MKRLISCFIAAVLMLCGCAADNKEIVYQKISPEEANDIMESGDAFILLDVRTQEEFAAGHIEGAVLIPDYEIAARIQTEIPDKDTLLLIYCRTGRRSANTAHLLIEMGYTNVYDFGGIVDWPFGVVVRSSN